MNHQWDSKVPVEEVVHRINKNNPAAKLRVTHNKLSINCIKAHRSLVVADINEVVKEIKTEMAVQGDDWKPSNYGGDCV